MRKLLALVCCLALLASCGGSGDEAEDVPTGAANAPSQVTGVILDVQSESLQEVTGFTVKDGDQTYEVLIDPDVDYGFDLGHLREHLRTAGPVFVTLELRDGKLYAQSIEDV